LIVNINVLHLPTQKHSANKLKTVAFFQVNVNISGCSDV